MIGKTIDWFEPVEFEDGTQILKVDIAHKHPGLVKVWPETRPTGYPADRIYGDPVADGINVKLDGSPTMKDWDDAVPMVVQKQDDPPGWGQF